MKKYKDGVHIIENKDYHSSHGVSRSRLMALKKSPEHFAFPGKFKTSPAMTVGSLVHTILLEPGKFDDEFAIVPEVNKRTKLGKQQHEAFELANFGKTLVTEDQIAQANDMVLGIKCNHDALALLETPDLSIEHSIYWSERTTGVQFKARPDIWHQESGLVIDIKTTADASPWGFSNSAYKFGYFLQAAMIAEALESLGKPMTRFVVIAVENKDPYVPAVYIMDELSIELARTEFTKLAGDLKACYDSNRWPGYATSMLTLPRYAENTDE